MAYRNGSLAALGRHPSSRACRRIDAARGRRPVVDEAAPTGAIVASALPFGRYAASSPASAWLSGSLVSAARWTCSRTCSACAARQAVSTRTTGRISSPKRPRTGSRRSAQRPPTSSRAVRGRTVICESFTAKLRAGRLDGGVFCTLKEASVVIERQRRHDDSIRPHCWFGNRPPALEVLIGPTGPNGPTPLAVPDLDEPDASRSGPRDRGAAAFRRTSWVLTHKTWSKPCHRHATDDAPTSSPVH